MLRRLKARRRVRFKAVVRGQEKAVYKLSAESAVLKATKQQTITLHRNNEERKKKNLMRWSRENDSHGYHRTVSFTSKSSSLPQTRFWVRAWLAKTDSVTLLWRSKISPRNPARNVKIRDHKMCSPNMCKPGFPCETVLTKKKKKLSSLYDVIFFANVYNFLKFRG